MTDVPGIRTDSSAIEGDHSQLESDSVDVGSIQNEFAESTKPFSPKPGCVNDAVTDEHPTEPLALTASLEHSGEPTTSPLPFRPSRRDTYTHTRLGTSSLKLRGSSPGTSLQSRATTALSLADVHTQTHNDGSSSYDSPQSRSLSRQRSLSRLGQHASRGGSDAEDTASIKSYVPILDTSGDVESLLGDVRIAEDEERWKAFSPRTGRIDFFEGQHRFAPEFESAFEHEFDDLEELHMDGSNEESLMRRWTAKLKHFFILSSAGKPIYSRHGDDQLISNSIGILQTIISFYQGADDELKCFVAGETRFVVLSKGHLHLGAISRMGETDSQLRAQLEALYMQILSTLTLPKMKQMFINRPSTDLRRPLQGTESLLSALADGFTRGSPSTLLGALECLRMRKSHRQNINNTFLKVKTPNLLYGLVVAGGRLVSVLRPKKQSLYPGDLQLMFNMLFEADSVRAGGGENWIPLCLPGFNNTGYLYMYVSFLEAVSTDAGANERTGSLSSKEEEIAIILISRDGESFYELKKMSEDLINQLESNGSMSIIRSAVRKGRPPCTEIVPGATLVHFVYKSRANVQFTMPSASPRFERATTWRKLMCIYHTLNASVHSRTAYQKVHHCVSRDFVSVAWVTPVFELYCVASPTASRDAVAQGANKVVQWAKREEERLFIVGGAVF